MIAPDSRSRRPRSNLVPGEEPVRGRLRGRSGSPLGAVSVLFIALALSAFVAWSVGKGPAQSSEPSISAIGEASDLPPTTANSSAEVISSATPSQGADDVDLQVEQSVIDRPGVPSALYDKYWVALGQVGQVGTTARIVMPSDEVVLGVDEGQVASMAVDTNTYRPILGEHGVTILIRDVRTGKTTRSIETGVNVTSGLLSGPLMFWAGITLPSADQRTNDAGIWVVDISDPASTPKAVIDPGDLTSTYGSNASRSHLALGDRGRVIMSSIVGDKLRATQVVDIATLLPRPTLNGQIAYQIVDGVAVVREPLGVALLDADTYAELGPSVKADEVYQAVAGDREVFVQYGRAGEGVYVTAIALDTGATRDILVQPLGVTTLDLTPQLSAPDILVLLDENLITVDERGYVQIPVSLLDPVTGVLSANAFTIGAP